MQKHTEWKIYFQWAFLLQLKLHSKEKCYQITKNIPIKSSQKYSYMIFFFRECTSISIIQLSYLLWQYQMQQCKTCPGICQICWNCHWWQFWHYQMLPSAGSLVRFFPQEFDFLPVRSILQGNRNWNHDLFGFNNNMIILCAYNSICKYWIIIGKD